MRSLLPTLHDLHCFPHSIDGCGNKSLRRMPLNISESAHPRFSQLITIGECRAQSLRQRGDVPRGKDKLRPNRRNQIARCADLVADDHWTAAVYELVDDNRERFVAGRKHHHIRREVQSRQLRLIYEAEKFYACLEAELYGLGF